MENLGARMAEWALAEPSVDGLVLIGSRVRAAEDTVWRADPCSDWDFQIITREPETFLTRDWAERLGCGLRVYTVRRAAIGGVPKAAALFDEAEADFVVAPFELLARMRSGVMQDEHRTSAEFVRTVQDLAVVIRPGWRFLKGADEWEPFYRKVVNEVVDPRLGDAQIMNLAEGFVCDFIWTRRKIVRGELIAAQRMLHRSLAETNLQLLHELKLRRGERSFPEGRRAELVLSRDELKLLSVEARLERASLTKSLQEAANACRSLVAALIGDAWRWPELEADQPR